MQWQWPGDEVQLIDSRTFGIGNRGVINGVLGGCMQPAVRARIYLSLMLVWLAVLIEIAFASALGVTIVWLIRNVR